MLCRGFGSTRRPPPSSVPMLAGVPRRWCVPHVWASERGLEHGLSGPMAAPLPGRVGVREQGPTTSLI